MLPLPLQIETKALRKYRYFESNDIEDTRQRIATVLQPHRLIPGSSLAGQMAYMNHVRLDNVSFGSLGYAGAMGVEAGEIEDYFLVILSLRGYADVSVGGRRAMVSQSQGVIVGPQTSFGGTFSSDCEQFFVRIEKQAIFDHAGYGRLHLEPTLNLSRTELAPWLAQISMLIGSPETVALAQRDRRVAIEVERLLVTLLLAGQPHRSQENVRSSVLLPRTVRRAESYIAEHATESLKLLDIAEAAGVPVRTLLHSFRQFRGVSPMHLVREARMETAREMLQSARETDRVADIALICGFVNLGRFASVYREKFGESPSETLRNVRQRGA
ncbi:MULTISPECIES: AraC family transcriptional regulator [Burkholderiaceae]|uniref:Transcriptional regulator, AraC family n=1 Tax=Caballeronia sordidicola TaxID=196367 RepID=A0A242MLM3_CABSO|nr:MULTISPECIES: helix-turn-helix domain-containing protein [Burkholderiaceae]AME28402.1 AraC family transcriptional regulator [Burkholderia sp. PAMC 26561]OTP72153.1 Transcriptional regulator, AraC family [Caballeronia sordidicola]